MTSHLISYMARRAESLARTIGASAGPGASSERLQAFIGTPDTEGQASEGCTFCDILAGKQEAYKIYEDEHTLAFLDILPIRDGHVLVIPKLHYARV